MATKGYVVAAVVGFSILLIVLIVWLATSAGSGSKAPGSAGNWTAAQVAGQARLFGAGPNAIQLTKLGLTRDFVDKVAACAMEDASKRYGYDHMNACNTGVRTCVPTADDTRAFASCMGGEKGKWSAEMKSMLQEAAKATMNGDPALLSALPCIMDYLSSNYSFSDLIAEVARGKSDNIANAGVACTVGSLGSTPG